MLPFILISLLAMLIVYASSVFRIRGISPLVVLGGFVLKCLAGLFLLWLYTSVMPVERAKADVYKYFDDAIEMHKATEESPTLFWGLWFGQEGAEYASYELEMNHWHGAEESFFEDDDRSVIRLHAIMLFISGGDIRVHVILFALLAYLGLVLLFKGWRMRIPMPGWLFVVACVIPPSLLIWSSSVLKESLVFLPLGMAVYGLMSQGPKIWRGLLLLASVVLFAMMKPYVGICLIPIVLYRLLESTIKIRFSIAAISTVILFGAGLFLALTSPHLVEQMSNQQAIFIAHAQAEEAGSLIEVASYDDWPGFLAQTPKALVNVLMRPHLGETRGVFDALSAIENTFFLLIGLLVLFKRDKHVDREAAWMLLVYIVALAVLIGSVTPVLGAIVRYKVPIIPFAIFALYAFVDKKHRLIQPS